ncbi:50S ribosomal protein L34, chloroplastic [Juglans microcarpa x Juglans regia]|uniref:50S ribosomal protein L34, chloroplastic n=1 Tax=Juglans microcarpa x Juglans regia TaxID=2249226 RepID=UPI001B7EBD71|nr:50S ribosomal protein L34, chloroplastic [Juglans microcarpa x Juglans regia]
MASLTVLSSASPLLSCGGGRQACIPSASLTFLAGSTRRSSVSLNAGSNPIPRSGLLHCSFIPSSSSSFSSSFSFPSSFSGLSLGLNLSYGIGVGREKGRSLVVRAGKFALCQTKRNRSRKSLARTHGFRRRMRTTSGRAILKRRRAKGRKVLCTKSNPNSGKRA